MPDSRIAAAKGPGNVDRKNLGRTAGWGDLPAKEREEALQQIGKDFPSHYRDIIEQYFKKLATEDGGGPLEYQGRYDPSSAQRNSSTCGRQRSSRGTSVMALLMLAVLIAAQQRRTCRRLPANDRRAASLSIMDETITVATAAGDRALAVQGTFWAYRSLAAAMQPLRPRLPGSS